MTERNQLILDAAYRVFSRFGVAKTTMADIAQEAGVARQTVYNAYQNKEDLLRAVTRKGIANTEAQVMSAWENSDTFETKLDHFFNLGPLTWYDMVQASPQAAELIDGIHRVAQAELAEAAQLWRGHFQRLLDTHFDTTSLNVPAVADFIYATAINAKFGAEGRGDIENRLAILKASVIAMLPDEHN